MANTCNANPVDNNWDPPPPYEAISPANLGTANLPASYVPPYRAAPLPEVLTTNDGRVDVRAGQRFSRNVEWLMRHSSTRQPTDKHETLLSKSSAAAATCNPSSPSAQNSKNTATASD